MRALRWQVAAVSRTHTHAVWHARALGSCSSQGIVGSACFLTKYIYLLNHVAGHSGNIFNIYV